MAVINFEVSPKFTEDCYYDYKLSDCLWILDHNNPANFEEKPNWKHVPFYFVYNINYIDKDVTKVIFSVGYLSEEYIKHNNIDPATQRYWTGTVRFDDYASKLFITDIKEWQYDNKLEGSKQKGWIYRGKLKNLFKVEVVL